MPTYDYRCTVCSHTFEEFQSISAAPLLTCPACGKPGLRRALGTGAGMIFKGNGFYLTDYRKTARSSDSPPPAAKESPAGESPSPAKTSADPA